MGIHHLCDLWVLPPYYGPKFSPNFSVVWRVGMLGISIFSNRIYGCLERCIKKIAIKKQGTVKNQRTIPVHLPPNLQVLPPPPVDPSAESIADYQSGLSSIRYSNRSDLEAFSTPSLARTVSSASSDGVSIAMWVFVFCLIIHGVNISSSNRL